MLPDSFVLGNHGLIYANTRVMWRTCEKISGLDGQPVVFPDAYRPWVEEVYQETAWENEPPEISEAYQVFLDHHENAKRFAAELMVSSAQNMTPLVDDDQKVTAVTRDGEMSLTLVPFESTRQGRRLRNHKICEELDPGDLPEALAMNKVSVPRSWRYALEGNCTEEENVYWLAMGADDDVRHTRMGNWELRYDSKKGMERIK
jgi:CRISPR-associated endonuclease/helicase Cas3